MSHRTLEVFFAPASVAVIGASRSPEKIGYGVLRNVIESGYPGPVYPVNLHGEPVLGLTAYTRVTAIPHPVDLAVLVVPAPAVAAALEDCGQKGVRGAIVISAGFREIGAEGATREREVVEIARRHGLRLVGPNCLGVIDTLCPLNASFARGMPEHGNIAMVSQSGALASGILDWAAGRHVGFARFLTLGNKADVDENDVLEAWCEDPASGVIAGYLESIADGQEFIRIARAVSRLKPLIVLKSGTTGAGSRAVSSHTGSLAGSEAAYQAAFSQAGVIRARSIEELFDYTVAFAHQPLMGGNRIAIVTNAGGPGIMATDAAEKAGIRLAELSRATIAALRGRLPAAANVYNPIDVLGDAGPEAYGFALDTVLADDAVDGVVVLLTPQIFTRIEETAQAVLTATRRHEKPVMASFLGGQAVAPGIEILGRNGVPVFSFPERAVKTLTAMAQRRRWLDTDWGMVPRFDLDRDRIQRTFAKVRASGRATLAELEAREAIAACGLRVPRAQLARGPEEAARIATAIGFPVALKVASPEILHKSDIGGVRLGLQTPEEVFAAYELVEYRARHYAPEAEIWGATIQQMVPPGREVIIGMTRDPQFGPLLAFGLGGVYVEVLKDVTFRVAPITDLEARRMVEEIRTFQLLQGARGGQPSDIDAAIDYVLRISQFALEFPEVVELDINPLVLYAPGEGALAVDARMTLA